MKSTPTYEDGVEIDVGDEVLIERGRTPGTVTNVIVSEFDQKEWNVEESGVMIESAPFGLVFIPCATFSDDPIVLVKKNET